MKKTVIALSLAAICGLQMFGCSTTYADSLSAQENIRKNTQDASDAAAVEADINFFYSPGGVYKIYCRPGYLTDIKLQPGENITYIGGGDTVRWIVDKAQAGGEKGKQWHVYVKPLRSNIETNVIINTDRHSYQMQCVASTWYNPIVAWSYPAEEQSAFMKEQEQQRKLDNETINLMAQPDSLNFVYKVTRGENYDWAPTVIFDDGQKVYIKMNTTTMFKEAPALFVKDEKGKSALVNYRMKNGYYIVDKLFMEAELRIGTKDFVRIRKVK